MEEMIQNYNAQIHDKKRKNNYMHFGSSELVPQIERLMYLKCRYNKIIWRRAKHKEKGET